MAGENNQIVEFDVIEGSPSHFIRYRVLSTVGGSGAQLTEMGFWGVGIKAVE